MTDRTVRPVFARPEDQPIAGWDDSRGRLTWARLFSAGATPTDTFTMGVATIMPGGFLALHRHIPAETYYVVEGAGIITIDGLSRQVSAGDAIFIPGNAEHGIRNESAAPMRFLYTFAVDRFEVIEYVFTEAAQAS